MNLSLYLLYANLFFVNRPTNGKNKFEWARGLLSIKNVYYLLKVVRENLLAKCLNYGHSQNLKSAKCKKFRGLTEPSRFPSENFYSFKVKE